jgi:hypothetical protein
VLAVVGPGREVTVSLFQRSWRQVAPPARPDSLTPKAAREFLDLLIDKEALGAAANRERWAWTSREQIEYDQLLDRLTIAVVLESSLVLARRSVGAAGDTLSREALGIVARDSAVARTHPTFDEPLSERLAHVWAALPKSSSDSSFNANMKLLGTDPHVDPTDTGRVIARSDVGEYRVGELLRSWKALSPIYRPRVQTASQIRDLARNGIYERLLRGEVARRHIPQRPEIVRELERQREYTNVTHLVQREVFAKVSTDSLTLLRHYRAHPREWDLPLRVRLIRVLMPDQDEATAMALELRNEARAETLAAIAKRSGTDWRIEVSAQTDSLLFRRALRSGIGVVLGPDEGKDGWTVARVTAVLPSRPRTFAEVRELVAHDWRAKEGERLMRALCDRARRAEGVRINQPALARVASR